jgi:hypothetical protein
MDVIQVDALSADHAQRLISSIGGAFPARVDSDGNANIVGITLDDETAVKLVELFDALGEWLADGGIAACKVRFGNRMYTLAAPSDGQPNDPAAFLLERTFQRRRALDSQAVIERAKGILAEQEGVTPEEALERLRGEARSKRMNIHVLAAGVVATTAEVTPGR